jgi:hypothetical protein
MTTTTRVIVVAVMLMLMAGAGGAAGADPPLEPLVLGGEQFFRLEWEAGERRGRPVVRGSIVNEWGFPARRVQLLVEGLDAGGRVVSQRVAWLGGELTPGSRAWFDVRVAESAPAYRVRVFAWDWIQSASAEMP